MNAHRNAHGLGTDDTDEMAARWVVRLDDDGTAQTIEEFERWRRADRSHAEAFARIKATRAALGQLAQIKHRPEVAAIALDAAAGRRRRRWRLRLFPVALAAAAAVAVGIYFHGERVRRARPLTAEFVAMDVARHLALPDGSTVELNAASRIETTFTPTERRVTLASGEAHFSVQKDPARPFVVVAGGVAVRAIGTAFNVRLMNDAAVEVLVTEGRVQVSQAPLQSASPAALAAPPSSVTDAISTADVPLLEAGHRAIVTTRAEASSSKVEAVDQTEIDRVRSWHTSSLVFSETPLSEVLAQFNRRNRVRLVLGDATLAARPVSGNIRVDNAETFAGLLESGGDIVADRSEPGVIVLRKAR
jgi:transmembrane sensor